MEKKVIKQKIENTIKNKILIATDWKSVRWYNQYRLIPKPNNDNRLVLDMGRVNEFMKLIHFKMEGTPALEQLMIIRYHMT
jgi:hypothetical protein